jgi:hypothetical protein
MSDQQRQTVGPWTLDEDLGGGGNGTVWKATRPGLATAVALKVLNVTKIEHESYRRFVREISFLRRQQGTPGLLPLLDSHLPDRPSKSDRPWLAMPIATPIAESLAGRTLPDVVEAVATIAGTLARMQADFDIAHRDIKPGNLYELDGAWLIGDFGLIALPNAETLTHDGRQVGPAHYTAYEMILSPKAARPHPADVYSLGKVDEDKHVVGPGRLDACGQRQDPQVVPGSPAWMEAARLKRRTDLAERPGQLVVGQAVDAGSARCSRFQSEEDAKGRGFAGAVRPEESSHRSLLDVEAQATDGCYGTESLDKVADLDGCHGGSLQRAALPCRHPDGSARLSRRCSQPQRT